MKEAYYWILIGVAVGLLIYLGDKYIFWFLSMEKNKNFSEENITFVSRETDELSSEEMGQLIKLYNETMEDQRTEKEFKAKDAEIKEIVTQASDFALESPEPAIEELWTDVYAS